MCEKDLSDLKSRAIRLSNQFFVGVLKLNVPRNVKAFISETLSRIITKSFDINLLSRRLLLIVKAPLNPLFELFECYLLHYSMNGFDAVVEVCFFGKEIFEILPETFVQVTRSMQTAYSIKN